MAPSFAPDAPRHTGSGAPPCPTVIHHGGKLPHGVYLAAYFRLARVALSVRLRVRQPYLRGGYRYRWQSPVAGNVSGKSVNAARDVPAVA